MEKTIKTLIISFVICFVMIIILFLIAIKNMLIDHKCYLMEDKIFYSNKMCKKYWEDRKNE